MKYALIILSTVDLHTQITLVAALSIIFLANCFDIDGAAFIEDWKQLHLS